MPSAPRNLQEAYSTLAAAMEMVGQVQEYMANLGVLMGAPINPTKTGQSNSATNARSGSRVAAPEAMTDRVITILKTVGKPIFPAEIRAWHEDLNWEYNGDGTLATAISGAVAYLFARGRLARNDYGYFIPPEPVASQEEGS